jgi:hypothetical protein
MKIQAWGLVSEALTKLNSEHMGSVTRLDEDNLVFMAVVQRVIWVGFNGEVEDSRSGFHFFVHRR